MSEFAHRFNVPDFAARVGKVSLTAIWQEYLQWAQYQNRATSSREMRIAFCQILVRHYNKGIRSDSGRYLRMEGTV